MTDNNKCNGWTNYETWRVNLEIFYGWETDGHEVCGESIQDIAEQFIDASAPDGLAKDYAMAFLNAVNWEEIADHINEANEEG